MAVALEDARRRAATSVSRGGSVEVAALGDTRSTRRVVSERRGGSVEVAALGDTRSTRRVVSKRRGGSVEVADLGDLRLVSSNDVRGKWQHGESVICRLDEVGARRTDEARSRRRPGRRRQSSNAAPPTTSGHARRATSTSGGGRGRGKCKRTGSRLRGVSTVSSCRPFVGRRPAAHLPRSRPGDWLDSIRRHHHSPRREECGGVPNVCSFLGRGNCESGRSDAEFRILGNEKSFAPYVAR